MNVLSNGTFATDRRLLESLTENLSIVPASALTLNFSVDLFPLGGFYEF